MVQLLLKKRLLQLRLLFLCLAIAAIAGGDKTYYQLLDVDQDATLKDIKKAYRRLALEHHPDRNRGNEKEAELIFRDISEAYEVLSDESSRRDYDRSLKYGGGSSRGRSDFGTQFRRSSKHRDPFAQFNDLFQNDAFFRDAAQGMEDLFKEVFEQPGSGGKNANQGGDESGGGGFFGNMFKKMGMNVEFQTSYSTGTGSSQTQRTSRSSSSWGSGSSSYESRSTRTVIENGQRVTIQSIEKNGNKIEEKYIGDKLIERKINGEVKAIGGGGVGQEF